MRLACLAAVLAGCFSPTYPEQLRCGIGDAPCPPGQLCDRGVCVTTPGGGDANVDVALDGPPDDVDADGVKNEMDNCPGHYNPMQLDEDADMLGNECDPCPPSPENQDRDSDGVGDVCDPAPDTAGDTMVLFEGFDNGVPSDWTPVGNWQPGPSEISISLGDQELRYVVPPLVVDEHGSASAAFVTQTVNLDFTNRAVSVSRLSDTNKGIGCSAALDSASDQRGLAMIDHSSTTIAETPSSWTDGAVHYLHNIRTDANSYLCALGGAGVADTIMGEYVEPAPLSLAIRSRSISMSFRYLMYVDSPLR